MGGLLGHRGHGVSLLLEPSRGALQTRALTSPLHKGERH